MEFGILGPLTGVGDDGVALTLGGRGDRALLARLLVHANSMVPVDVLAEELWHGAPPANAAGAVQSRVSRLRRALGPASRAIVTRAPGYAVQLTVDELDASRFETLAADGRAALAAGDAPLASERLAAGLALWRGPALCDVATTGALMAEAARLEEARLAAVEDRVEADLACGRHHALVGELEVLTRSHPLRERLWAHLMLALFRCERTTEALHAYQRVRDALAEDLGLEPGPSLARLEQAIVAKAAELEWIAPVPASAPVPPGGTQRGARGGIVTLLFTDMVASTSLLERLGDDRAEHVRRTHFALLREAIAAHGGREVKNLGDGLMVVFTSAVSGVAAAAEMQQAVARYNRTQAETDGAQFAVRVGVHVGDPIEDEGDYFGTPVVVAARLCDAAAGGQILASSLVEALVGERAGVSFTPVGPLCCRGVARPLDAVQVAWEFTHRHRFSVPPTITEALARPATTLTGRADALSRLRTAWASAVSGSRAMALVSGEPGIGKTRLLAELAHIAHDSGGTALYGRCDEGLEFPAQPFVHALRHVVDAVPADWLSGALDASALAALRRMVPRLAPQVLPGETDPVAYEDPELARYHLFDTVDQVLALLTEDAPVLLVLDDLHCADAATLQLLRHLGRRPGPARLLVAGAYRDVETGPRHPLHGVAADLREGGELTSVVLGGLGVGDIEQLVSELASAPLDINGRALAARLHEVSGGNPMLVHEMFRHLAGVGTVAVGPDGWRYDSPVAADTLPVGVQEIIERRLGRLSHETNRILTLASVVGHDFALDVVEHVSDCAPSTVLEAVEEGVAAKVISEISGAFARYRFQHPLVHETLFRRTSLARRDRLRRRMQEVSDRLGLV